MSTSVEWGDKQSHYLPQQPPRPQQPIYDGYSLPGYGHLAVPLQQYPRSITSGYAHSLWHSAGVIAPQPLNEPDASLELYTQTGMTPAQAYQAQIMAHDERDPSPSGGLYGPRDLNPPRLSVDVADVGADLDFEFGGDDDDSGPGSDPGTEDGSSDLPYRSTPNASAQNHRVSGLSDVSSGSHQSTILPSSRPHPLQFDIALTSKASTVLNNLPAVSTYVEQVGSSVTNGNSARHSSESTRMIPRPLVVRRERTVQDRPRFYRASPLPPLPTKHGSPGSPALNASTRRTPIVHYPALLSCVAEAFRVRMTLTERVKDGLAYTDAFDGREAVDKLAYIIKTNDRNLVLLLGRALAAQKFFHDVTYDNRLRDSPNELYQFRTKIPCPFISIEQEQAGNGNGNGTDIATDGHGGTSSDRSPMDVHLSSGDTVPQVNDGTSQLFPTTGPRSGSASCDEVPLPSGVFTLLTDCYSPTCSRDSLCYSITCPRRLEQLARLNMKPQPGLKRRISEEVELGDLMEPRSLWAHSTPKEIVDTVSETERKRQEAINEVMCSERDFVQDMEYLRDVWIGPLKKSDIIPEERRLVFLEQVFWNIHEIIAVNTRLRDALNKRQKSCAVVGRIGDILREVVPHFAPFVSYGSHQLYGKYEFEKEKSSNPAFQKFVDETERLPVSRRLELNGYLTKPTTRLARYPLLFDVVLKNTPDDNPDKEDLIKVVATVRDFLIKVTVESRRTENRFNLLQLDKQLTFRPGEEVDLRLKEEGRELLYKGNLKRRAGGGQASGDLELFLFDHVLLMVKKAKHEQYKVYRRPIPIKLLLISAPEETTTGRQDEKTQLQAIHSFGKTPPAQSSAKDGFSITFVHLGRNHYQITLWASTYVGRKKWMENITRHQDIVKARSLIFDTVALSEGVFHGVNQVNCAAPFNGGRRIAYGTNDGVYFTLPGEPCREPVKVLALLDVTQVDILEEYQLLIVLSERQVITFPLDGLSEHDPMAGLRRAKRIASHTSFFKAGTCLGKTLVCVVKGSQLSTTIKALEPIEYTVRGKKKPTFQRLLQGGNDTLRLFKEFYIPVESSSIHYLKTKLCVGCTKGFEIVDLDTLDTQSLLDPSDTSLDFVQKREDVRPMAIYRIENDFLLCYDEFAFYVNKNGWRARPKFMVHWEGHPRAFALHYPYILAFEPTFVEVRHVETGTMSQVIQGNNFRCLFAGTPPSTTNSPANFYDGNYPLGYRPESVYGKKSMSSQHSVPRLYHNAVPGYNPYHGNHAFGSDEIIVVSDDKVMALQMIRPAFPQDGAPSTTPSGNEWEAWWEEHTKDIAALLRKQLNFDATSKMECGMMTSSVKIYQRLVVYVYAKMKILSTTSEFIGSLRETLLKWEQWNDLEWLANHHIVRKTLWDMLDMNGTIPDDHDCNLRRILDYDMDVIQKQVINVLNNRQLKRNFLDLCQSDPIPIANLLQTLIDRVDLPPESHAKLVRALARLSKSSRCYPDCLILSTVRRTGSDPVAGGGFADVWMGYFAEKPVALKALRIYKQSLRDKVLKEFSHEAVIWRQLKHPNILAFYGVFTGDEHFDRLCLVSPWMDAGNAIDYLTIHPEGDRLSLLSDVTQGLEYLHLFQPPIIHGDLKGANIFVTSSFTACLGDFGLARFRDSQESTLATTGYTTGTLRWQAPELLSIYEDEDTIPRSEQTDVYSFGCVCLELMTGMPPFMEIRKDGAVMRAILDGRTPRRPLDVLKLGLDDRLWTLMLQCWNFDPTSRPKTTQLVEHFKSHPRESKVTTETISQRPRASLDQYGFPGQYVSAVSGLTANEKNSNAEQF